MVLIVPRSWFERRENNLKNSTGISIKILCIILSTILLILQLACTSQDGSYAESENAELQNEISSHNGLDNGDLQELDIIYSHDLSFRLDIDFTWLVGAYLHNDLLNFILMDWDNVTGYSYVFLYSMSADGTNGREVYRTLLNTAVDLFMIRGFDMHDDGYLSLITRDQIILPPYTRDDYLAGIFPAEWSNSYVYRKISPDGEIVSEFGIDALNTDLRQITTMDAIFGLDESAVLSVFWLIDDSALLSADETVVERSVIDAFFIFDSGLTKGFREIENTTMATRFSRSHDGQIIGSPRIWAGGAEFTLYYIIDIDNASIVDGPRSGPNSPVDQLDGVFAAPPTSEFDFYLLSQSRLYGYTESGGRYVHLINFVDFGIRDTGGRSGIDIRDILFWDDGRITVVVSEYDAITDNQKFFMHLLTPDYAP